jgi:hypothetical protein
MIDIIAIIFIIALSFLFCMNDKNYNCQMSHIVIGLSVMVFYKLARVLKLNRTTTEAFNTTNSLADFIAGGANVVGTDIPNPTQLQNLSSSDLAKYNDKLDLLINSINNLNSQRNSTTANLSLNPENIQKLDLESQQQYQLFQIDYLNKQIQNAKDILNSQTISENATNYKPIKVYSSCVISNADGTTTVDTPIANNLSNDLTTMGNNNAATSDSNMIGGDISNASNNNSSFVNLSPSTGVFNDFFKNLAQSQGNININL